MGREGVPSPTIDDALQMYDGREFRSKGGGGENYYSSHPTPIQIRALGVGNVIWSTMVLCGRENVFPLQEICRCDSQLFVEFD